jgi:uracil-DNA glycosylase family 4
MPASALAPVTTHVLGNKVPSYGPRSADIMLVGEAPGVQEEMQRKPLVGKTGVETRRLCRQAGIDFDKTYRANICKYRPLTRASTGNVKPTQADIKRDEGELVDELETVRPAFVVAVGATAARWLLGSDTFTGMEDCHGFAYPTANWRAAVRNTRKGVDRGRNEIDERYTDGVLARAIPLPEALISVAHFIVVVVYHPAAGLHQVETQPLIYSDFMTLGKYIRGELPLYRPVDEHPDPDYYEPRMGVELVKSLPVAVDTEGLRGRAWGLSFSQTPGSAGVVRKTNKRAMKSVKEQLLS